MFVTGVRVRFENERRGFRGELRYNETMANRTETLPDVKPSATPTKAELEAWDALPQGEQMRRLQLSFADPACARPVADTMTDLLRQARSAARPAHGE